MSEAEHVDESHKYGRYSHIPTQLNFTPAVRRKALYQSIQRPLRCVTCETKAQPTTIAVESRRGIQTRITTTDKRQRPIPRLAVHILVRRLEYVPGRLSTLAIVQAFAFNLLGSVVSERPFHVVAEMEYTSKSRVLQSTRKMGLEMVQSCQSS